MDMIECRFCTGEVPERAQKCKHCGEWLKDPPPSRQLTDVSNISISSADLVTKCVPPIESLLEKKFSGHGRGLHEKLTSVAPLIPSDLQKKIRRIASIRNDVIHEGLKIESFENFDSNCQSVLEELEALQIRSSESNNREIENATSSKIGAFFIFGGILVLFLGFFGIKNTISGADFVSTFWSAVLAIFMLLGILFIFGGVKCLAKGDTEERNNRKFEG